MDHQRRGLESGRGHGHCRGRGRGVREVPIPDAHPAILRGPTSRGILSYPVVTPGELRGRGRRSDVGEPLPIPDTSTVTGGRGRGRQVPVVNNATETFEPTDGGVEAAVNRASKETDSAESDHGSTVPNLNAPTAASGRGRGGRVQKPLPIISKHTSDLADRGEQATECRGSGETGGTGRGRGIKKVPLRIVSTPLVASGSADLGIESDEPRTSMVDSTPTPECGAEEEGSSKIVEKELTTLQEMFDYKFKSTKKGRTDSHIVCENWAYPKGINRPVMVVSMNEYVNSDDEFIPGEIVITPFTLKYGIDLMYTYWTRVDPGNNIPVEYEAEASTNVSNFDLPKPGTADEERHKDYERIVREITIFVKKNSTPAYFGEKDESEDVYFLFCKKKMVDRYTIGMNWIFALGGKEKFPFKLVPLETILVALSLGGLELEAARRGSVIGRFQKVVESFNHAVNSVVDPTVTSTEEIMQTAHELLSKFTGYADPRKYIQRFRSLGGKAKRLACQRLVQHPYAFLGAFMSEDQATRYLDSQEFINEKSLACDYHKEGDKMRTCAQLQAARMIYFALDVLLVNYGDGNRGIRPREDKHFPLTDRLSDSLN